MRSTALEKRLEALWDNQLPFVVFRLPESKKVTIFFQDDKQLYTTTDFSESGFVMTPFVNSEDCPFIPDSKTEHFTKPSIQLFNTKPIVFPDSEQSKQEFLKLVQKSLGTKMFTPDEWPSIQKTMMTLSHASKLVFVFKGASGEQSGLPDTTKSPLARLQATLKLG